jgi:CRP-like cAMP-binding protein
MYIIFSGMIEIFTIMDNGTEFIIERLTSGSVINPTAFLIEDEIDTIFRAGSTATIFRLNVKQFVNETIKYPDFSSRTALRISDQLADRENSIALDYILGN